MRVLTLATLMSYNFLTEALIWCLLALMLTRKTKVLLSSIFFIADSVVRGCLMMLWASILRKEIGGTHEIHFIEDKHKYFLDIIISYK
jgi:hypothetical protein